MIVSDKTWDEFFKKPPKFFWQIFVEHVIWNSHSLIKKYAISNLAVQSKEQEKIGNLFQDLGRLYEESLFTDVELIVQGKTLKAHKGILSSMA